MSKNLIIYYVFKPPLKIMKNCEKSPKCENLIIYYVFDQF